MDWRNLLEVALVLALFAAEGAWPVPDVNEPHYVGKAKNFWDSTWIYHDFFLDSTDSHLVFYYAVGPLAWLSPTAICWTGRGITWTLLAVGWLRLHRAVGAPRWWAPLSAGWFVLLNHHCQIAGEWAVGGFEAKGLSYAFVLFALERMVRGSWSVAGCWFGAATSMHVLVGGWSTVAAGIGWLLLGSTRPSWRRLWPGLLGAAALAAPGVWVALRLTWGIDPAIVREANDIYVLGRLRHHLDPRFFDPVAVARFLLMCAVWLLSARWIRNDPATRIWRGFVWGALTIAACGTLIAWSLWPWPYARVDLLRFYWFRLSDVALAWGVALSLVVWLSQIDRRPIAARVLSLALIVAVVGHVGHQVWSKAIAPTPRSFRVASTLPRQAQHERWADWLAACNWAREQTTEDELFLTPRLQSTFKWYALRPEVVSWKDVPQDAPSLVEWWRRVKDIHRTPDAEGRMRWIDSLTQLSAERLRELGNEYGFGFIITRAEPRIALDMAYQNNSYAIYRVAPPDE